MDSMEKLASMNVREIVRFHGVLRSVVSERNVRFTKKFWTGLWDAMATRMCFGTAAHPETGAANVPLSASRSTPHTRTREGWAI